MNELDRRLPVGRRQQRWTPWVALGAVLLAFVGTTPSALALEALDGRIQAHGYVEMQLRTLSKNYGDQWDLTQWYNIFNLELEFDILDDTIGPLDLVSGYVRIEARFDCVYSRGCGVMKPVNSFGNRSKGLPSRLNRGDTYTTAGQIDISNDGPFTNSNRDPMLLRDTPGFEGIYDGNEEGFGDLRRRDLMRCPSDPCTIQDGTYKPWGAETRFWRADRNQRLRLNGGNPWEVEDDGTSGAPFLIAMEPFNEFKFVAVPVIGGSGNGHPLQLMGPWLPENTVTLNGSLTALANPLDSSRNSPQSLSVGAGGAPMRPIPIFREDDSEQSRIFIRDLTPYGQPDAERDANGVALNNLDTGFVDKYGWEVINPLVDDARSFNDRAATGTEARGLYIPSPRLKAALDENKFGTYDFNFSEQQRAFNRGASQNDEGELKEAYLDIEMFDSRLWMRVGKQTIVWGKTELFRTTDQFNPQDFALANLPSLEESRIGLWSWRGVYSFYEVGPLSDVRAEVAFNFDQFESADLGSCGEPFTINLVCSLTLGSWAHGVTGIGVAGFDKPPDPWNDLKGWEIGGRLEFRWDRFSFAVTDFYGYADFPHVERLSSYNRNVDWRSGRPRHYMHTEQDLALSYDGTVGKACATPAQNGIQLTASGAADTNGVPGFVNYVGTGNEGCLTPGPTDRTVNPDGTPFQVPTSLPSSHVWADYTTQFWNDTSRADVNDPRPDCFDGLYNANGGVPDVDCIAAGAGAYDARYDRLNVLADPAGAYRVTEVDPITGQVVPSGRFDSLKANDSGNFDVWLNNYDPTLAYNANNALDNSSTNMTVFNWVCATTTGFNELDPSACALTVFSSRKPAAKSLDAPVANVIAGLVSGNNVLLSQIGNVSSDEVLSKYSITPGLMGWPIVSLHTDTINGQDDLTTPAVNEVLNTYDVRQEWAVDLEDATTKVRIGAREAESYNCLPRFFLVDVGENWIGCGGLKWLGTKSAGPGDPDTRRLTIESYFGPVFTPEQEALLGCGPFFQTDCDTTGMDLLWAEGSALVQSFLGNDSLGISFADLGIADLVPAGYGTTLMDAGSIAREYRTDGRVVGSNGQLIRLNPITGAPELGNNTGLRSVGADGMDCNLTYEPFFVDADGNDANDLSGQEQEDRQRRAAGHRWNSRCWDMREYYVAYGLQPGTATFEALGLGGPKCTTPDIGGPIGQAGVLPGCRNKWATIRYDRLAPLAPGEVDHPNNPASKYVGNNYLGAAGDPTDRRTDYRQLSINAPFCANVNPDNDRDGSGVRDDCEIQAPINGNVAASGLNWGVFSPDLIPGCTSADYDVLDANQKPKCWLGGWVQEVDGDPDKVGINTGGLAIDFPVDFAATSGLYFNGSGLEDLGTYGTMVQRDYLAPSRLAANFPSGCTEAQAWIWMQRLSDDHGGGYLKHPECSAVKVGEGAGHPFTGESFASEVAGLSNSFMMFLVSFSEEFTDGIASVRGFVDPATYNGKLYSDQPIGPGDANWDDTTNAPRDDFLGIDDDLLPAPIGASQQEKDRLQRDPSLPNILDFFPDMKYYEEQSPWALDLANNPNRRRRMRLGNTTNGNAAFEAPRDNGTTVTNGKIFTQGGASGSEHRWRGLIQTMLWDYAFTGSENTLMSMIPQCTDERVTQERILLNTLDWTNPARIDCRDAEAGETLGRDRCTYVTPQHCSLVQAVFGIAGQKRNVLRAGGNGSFGRRTVQWQSGSEIFLSYEKRNVLGFSMDFAEDFTKSNWSTEFTYINGIPTFDADSYELTSRTDEFNLTVSVDRPTFVNFLNPNRTFFINSQWFFQYRTDYTNGMNPNGPWNVLATIAVFTGYFQDRLNPSMVGVYDFRSRSGAFLPSVNYRFNEAFSITIGASIFFGRQQLIDMPVNGIAPSGARGGINPYQDGMFGGLSVIKDRDELFVSLRYTF